MTAKTDMEYDKILADLTELHRNCSNLDTCPSCNMLRADLTKVVSKYYPLKELAASTGTHTSDEKTAALWVKVVQLQKKKDDLVGQLKASDALSQKRKEKLDSLDVEAMTAEISQLRETTTALEDTTNALRTEKSKVEQALGLVQQELRKTEDKIQKFQSCKKQAEALELIRRQKDQALEKVSGFQAELIAERIENSRLRIALEDVEELAWGYVSCDHGEKIGSLLKHERSPRTPTDVGIISSIVVCADASSILYKRHIMEEYDYEQPQAKRLRTSAEIAETSQRVEGWLDKPGQAALSHHTQHLALQSMIAIGAIDPVLTSLGATGILSLSDEGLKQFEWAQKYKELKTRKDFGELSERFAGRLQKLLQHHGLDKAGHLSTRKLSELVQHSRLHQPNVDDILSQLRQVLVSVQPLRQKLYTTLERISNGGTGDADFISCVEVLKQSAVPALFSVYTWEPGTLSHTEPGLARALRCDSVLGWRRRICDALASLATKYKDLEALKGQLELEWRPAYLLSDKELCEISACPEHPGTDASAS